jgi:hypothetical protein
MSLNFDYSRCIDRELWTNRDYEVLDRLIWGTIIVDLPSITEKNIDEWEWRMMFDTITDGSSHPHFRMSYENGDNIKIDTTHLRKFIGLSTNVSYIPRKAWVSKKMTVLTRRVDDLTRDRITAAK